MTIPQVLNVAGIAALLQSDNSVETEVHCKARTISFHIRVHVLIIKEIVSYNLTKHNLFFASNDERVGMRLKK